MRTSPRMGAQIEERHNSKSAMSVTSTPPTPCTVVLSMSLLVSLPTGVATRVAGIMSSSSGRFAFWEMRAFHSRSGCTASELSA